MAFMTFAENLSKSLEPMLASYSQTLLQRISDDYGLSYEDLSSKYLSSPVVPSKEVKKVRVPSTKKSKDPRPVCTGHTAKGEPCRVTCDPGSTLCHLHLKKSQKEPKEPKEPKVPKTSKKKVPPPTHDHDPDVVSMTCGLCESHGDTLNPTLAEQPYEVVEGEELANRLKSLIGDENPEDLEKEFVQHEESVPDSDPVEEDDEDDDDDVMNRLKGMLTEDFDEE